MIALRWHGREDVRLEDVELRLPLGPSTIEVEVAYCGICGSDLTEYARGPFAIRAQPHRLSGQEPPLTLGHEFSGRVVAIGEDVRDVTVGDRVAADACWRCERCPACRTGRYNLCPDGGSIGLASDGGFAARVRFPEYAVVPLPDGVSDRAGALLEPLAVGLHALDRGDARAGDTAIVLGFGAIGACTAMVGRALGLRMLVSEPHDGRRARAEQLGFEASSPQPNARDEGRAMRARTGGGAQLVVDCSGVPAALQSAPDMTMRGGNVVVVGLPKRPIELPADRLVLYERSLVGSLGYTHDLSRAATLIATGVLDPEALVTRTIPLTDAPAEFARLAGGGTDDIKVLVEPVTA